MCTKSLFQRNLVTFATKRRQVTLMLVLKLLHKYLTTFGRYLMLMGRSIAVPDRMRMFLKRYSKEMAQLGVDSIGIVILISFFIGAVICIQMKMNIQSPWMPRWVSGYTTREIMLLEFSSTESESKSAAFWKIIPISRRSIAFSFLFICMRLRPS